MSDSEQAKPVRYRTTFQGPAGGGGVSFRSKITEFKRVIGITLVILLTLLYIGTIFCLRGGEVWRLLWYGELNELGDFFAGVFSPVAFLWLIYGYFLQRKELKHTRKALFEQLRATKMQTKVLEGTQS